MRFVSIISTHTTLVGGDVGGIAGNEHVLISIHTILADRDKKAPVRSVQRREFQSTPPLRVETIMWTRRRCLSANFNPHHPCGWRPVYARCFCIGYEFQSTPPLWVETANLYSDTQYFPYRFGEIHNFALSPPTFLSSQSTKTALWAIFLARSSRKFYDCLGFALHRQTQHLIHYTMNAAL